MRRSKNIQRISEADTDRSIQLSSGIAMDDAEKKKAGESAPMIQLKEEDGEMAGQSPYMVNATKKLAGEGGQNPVKKKGSSDDTQIALEFNAFIPNDLNAEWYQDNKAWLQEPNPLTDELFASDDRTYGQSGSSRISHKATLVFNHWGELKSHLFKPIDIGWSHEADPIREQIWVPPHPYKDLGGYYRDGKVIGIEDIESKKAGNKGDNSFTDKSTENKYELTMRGEASYPFSNVAPDIDFKATFYVSVKKAGHDYYAYIYIVGTRDNFPAYEGIVRADGKRNDIYQQKVDKDDGPGLINLNTSEVFSSEVLVVKLSDW